ncbi:hypothetical protein COOONC_16692, partial [Cooperia oncophora]
LRLDGDFLRRPAIEEYLHGILEPLQDWAQYSKKQQLVKALAKRLKHWNLSEREQPLWKTDDYKFASRLWYYPLKTFSDRDRPSQCLPVKLLRQLSRRFDHFFMNYAIQAFRELVELYEDKGNFRLRRVPSFPENLFKARPKMTLSHEQHAKPALHTPTTSATVENGALSNEHGQKLLKRSHISQEVNEGEWEIEYYKRVKEDSALPAYFKTTFGILVANNQDLRDERAFLHSRLCLT